MKNNILLIIFCSVIAVYLSNHANSDEIGQPSIYEHKLAIEKINESLVYLQRADNEKISGNLLLSRHYTQISEIKLKTGQSLIRNYLIKSKTKELENDLNSIQSKNLKLQDEFRDNVSRLKQFKDKVILSNELIYNNSLNNLESAQSSISDAEQVDATIYSSNLLNKAHSHYEKASDNHKQGNYEQSVIESEQSIEFAKQAHKQAVDNHRKNESLINDLSNIFGFDSDIINGSFTLSSNDLFSPQSSSIRFDLYPSLDKIVEIIKNYENLMIEIKSYNNSFKSSNKNIELSKKQNETLKGYLLSKGINETSFVKSSYTTKELTKQRKVDIILNNSN